MVGFDFEERGCEGHAGGGRLNRGDLWGLHVLRGLSAILLRFGFPHLFFTHGDQFLLERELLLRRFRAVFIPRWSTSDLAAEWIWYAFGVPDLRGSAGNGNEGLQNGVDEDPPNLAGVTAGYRFILLQQRPRFLKSKIFADEAAFRDFNVAGIGSRRQCS